MSFIKNTKDGAYIKFTHGPERGNLYEYSLDDVKQGTVQSEFDNYNAKYEFQPTDRQQIAAGVQGATFGWGDELQAFYGAALDKVFAGEDFSDSYVALRDAYRDEVESYEQSDPLGYTVREVGGSLPTGFGIAGQMAKIPKIATALQGGWKSKQALKASAVIGATEGTIYGAGVAGGGSPVIQKDPRTGEITQTEDVLSSPLSQGLTTAGSGLGGAVGGPLGQTVVGAVGAAAGYTGRKLGDAVLALSNMLKERSQRVDISIPTADTILKDVLLGTDSTEDEAFAWLRNNPKATLADFNDSMQKIGETVAAKLHMPDNYLEFFSGRDTTAIDRIMLPVRKHFGGVVESGRTLSQIAEGREALAKPLYAQAMEEGVENTPVLRQIFEHMKKHTPERLNKSRRLGLEHALANSLPIDDEALGTALPTLRWWQAISQQLDDDIGTAIREGKGFEVANLVGIKKRITNELYAQNDAYRQANAIWQNSKHMENMVDAGRDLYKNKKLSEIFADSEDIKNLSPRDKQLFMLGFGESIENNLSSIIGTGDFGVMAGSMKTRSFLTKAMEEKLRLLLPDEAFEEFAEMIKMEARFKGTANRINKGSQTYAHNVVEAALRSKEAEIDKSTRSVVADKLMEQYRLSDPTVKDLQNRLFTPYSGHRYGQPYLPPPGQPFNPTGIASQAPVSPVSNLQLLGGSIGAAEGGRQGAAFVNPMFQSGNPLQIGTP